MFFLSGLIRQVLLYLLGRVAQSVMCLAADTCLTADPGVGSFIPAWSHTLVEIDHEIISKVILLLPLIQEGLLSVTSDVCPPSTG